jgi:Dolichyl-phosphate-mannose-protein mannosyltransferase
VSDTVRLLALNGGIAAVGALVVALAGVPLRAGWLPTVVGLAPAAGLATCGLVATLAAMAGIDVSVRSTAILAVAALLVAWAVVRRRRPGTGELLPPRTAAAGLALEIAALALLAVLSVQIVRVAAATRFEVWDGWAIWGPKTHALFVEGDVWGPVFADREYFMQHPEYPVLLPTLEALASSAIGRFDPSLADVEASVALVAFGWGAWAILRVVVMPAIAAAVALALTGSAPLIANVSANYADSVVAAFTALGVLSLIVWLTRGSTSTLVLSGLFLAAAASTKREGLLLALAAIAAALLVARAFGRPIRSVFLFAVGALAVPIAWGVVNRLNGPDPQVIHASDLLDPGYVGNAADRIPTAATRMVEEMADGWPLASLLALIAVAAVVGARLWWDAAFVVVWGVLAFSALVGVYFVERDPIDWLLGSSADRVIFSIVLGAATVAPVLVARAWEEIRRGSRDPT